MIVFLFYLAAILVFFTLCAAVADFIGWVNHDWQAEAERSLEDAKATRGKVT